MIPWIESWEEARAQAQGRGLPIFLWLYAHT